MTTRGVHDRPKRAVVTGGSRGIGRAICDALHHRGFAVVSMSRRSDPTHPAEQVEVDLSSPEATTRAFHSVLATGGVDVLVNNANAAVIGTSQIDEVRLEDLESAFQGNTRLAVQATSAVVPSMRELSWGRIVNISSLTTLGFIPGRTSYGSAKATLEFLTRAWAYEVATSGITVNAVAPGPVDTELFRVNNPPGSVGERRYLSSVPMGRLGRATEVASLVTFLCSDDASWITGQTIRIDGGASIGPQASV